MTLPKALAEILDFDKGGGLITAVAQDAVTGEVLMLAGMNPEALERTLETGEAVYWSRSRGRLWHKGEESGNVQRVREILVDCDGDALVLKVDQVGGAACHTGRRSCFFHRVTPEGIEITSEPLFDPEAVYGK